MAFNWDPVYANVMNSMFFVMLTPSKAPAHVNQLAYLAAAANTIDKGKKRDVLLKATKVSTGFAVGVRAGEIGILTTAHSIEHLFKASKPITKAQINALFTVRVLCGHYENAYRKAGNLNAVRAYSIGRVAWIDCAEDLMLVAVPVNSVMRFDGGGMPCPGPHPAMPMCRDDPNLPTQECLMVSWPEYKPDMMSIGRLGARRTVNQISQNRFEYRINVLEVQMSCGPGSSGAPLVNQQGEVIGVLHAAHEHDPSHSYFICAEHVRAFVGRFFPPPPLPPPPPESPESPESPVA